MQNGKKALIAMSGGSGFQRGGLSDEAAGLHLYGRDNEALR